MDYQTKRKILTFRDYSPHSNNHISVIYSAIVLLLILMACSSYSPVDSNFKYDLNISKEITISKGLFGQKRKTTYTINDLAINGHGIELINKIKTDKKSFFIYTKNYGPIKFNIKESNEGAAFIMSMTNEQKYKIKELISEFSKEDSLRFKQPSHHEEPKISKAKLPKGQIRISEPKFVRGGARSRASIMRVVMQNLAVQRYAYNKRLQEKPSLEGKITCKFAINEFGKVILCEILESTISDEQLETAAVDIIKKWDFEKIDKPGDVTEIIYPFVFSQ